MINAMNVDRDCTNLRIVTAAKMIGRWSEPIVGVDPPRFGEYGASASRSVRCRTLQAGALPGAIAASSPDDSKQDNHDSNHQQNVNETAHGVGRN